MTRVTAPVLQERVNVAAAHTDTSSARVEKTAQRARRTLQAVPPRIIDSLPAVRELVDVTEQLIVDATALRADVITERAVREELHVVTSVQIQALQQENAGLRKRPSRKKAAAVTVLGVVVGYIVGSRH
jgi:hypothetical protein